MTGAESPRCLVGTAAVTVAGDESSWVEPDYMSIPTDAELPWDEAQLRRVWPGPAMVMPAGLLPDGKPHSFTDMVNAERISGVRPRSGAEADACVVAYFRQQAVLRADAGLPPARLDSIGRYVETPETVAAIRELHRRERQRRRRIETPPPIARFLEQLAQAAVSAAEEMLTGHGMCPVPAVHLVCADMDPPYAAMITCRQFYRGTDAGNAIAAMGTLASQLHATHVVVVWEHLDLCTALELPAATSAAEPELSVVVVEAAFSEHLVRRYPVTLHAAHPGRSGAQTVLARWGEPSRERGGALPEPVARLLDNWHTWAEDDQLQRTVLDLEAAGYRIKWAQRS